MEYDNRNMTIIGILYSYVSLPEGNTYIIIIYKYSTESQRTPSSSDVPPLRLGDATEKSLRTRASEMVLAKGALGEVALR
jgi:hypothetical protein